MEFRFNGKPGLGLWLRLIVFLFLAAAIGIFLATLFIGIALILIPALAFASIVYYLYYWLTQRGRPPAAPLQDGVLEGEYRVLDPDEREPAPGPRHLPRQ